MKDELIIKSNIKPHKIVNNKWPDNILAPNLKPKLILRAILEIISIITKKGTKGKEVPEGINKPKYSNLCLIKPNIVKPIQIVILKLIVNINCALIAKL